MPYDPFDPYGYRAAQRQRLNDPTGVPQGYRPSDYNKNSGINDTRLNYESGQQLGTLGRAAGSADTSMDAFSHFDPSADFAANADAGLASTKNALGDELERLAGRSAGSGRLNTGFFDKDQGDVVRRFMGDYAADRTNKALQATSMRQQQLAQTAQFGQQARDRYLDFITGSQDRVQAQQNSKRDFLGSLFGSVAGAAGAIIPAL